MSIDIDPAWMLAVFYTALRLGVVLMMTPIFSNLAGLVTVRVLLTLALSSLLVSGLHAALPAPALEIGPVLLNALAEVVTGVTLAFGIFAAFGAFSVAGKILDVQSGFGLGNVYDPVTRTGAPLFATMLNLVAVAVFFGMDAHHALLRGIAFSLRQVAPGSGFHALDPEAAIRQFGLMFSLGVALIIPVMLCLLLAETGLAVVSRVLPQMNVFVVGVPVKIVVGLAVFAASMGTLQPLMARVYGSIFIYWEQVLT
ncbi:flagellar biosynthetic protein FliR [Duganella sp. HH101]|uniref:flagellar biosynthetic protein FliR n=1 Tax=Duganella sp. HH101 TaxID=1781066 RepID=UPI000874C7D4|nr:flagellar biosynthetic protein FliR [Duganella sp. HH101]OFA06685.1 flagellar biosynthetic protein FliR [Duganella sp. HH101]